MNTFERRMKFKVKVTRHVNMFKGKNVLKIKHAETNSDDKILSFKFARVYLYSTGLVLIKSDFAHLVSFLFQLAATLALLISTTSLIAYTRQSFDELCSKPVRILYFWLLLSLYLAGFCQRYEYFDLFLDLDKLIKRSE